MSDKWVIAKDGINSLCSGESYTIPESDYGLAEIHRIHDRLFLFQIPNFGGSPLFDSDYSTSEVDLILDKAKKLT